MLVVFFWVNPRRLEFICRHFGTLCLFYLHSQVDVSSDSTHIYLPMKMEQSVPKRRHINSRRRGFTQNKAYNIQNTVKAWNQECFTLVGITAWIVSRFFSFQTRLPASNWWSLRRRSDWSNVKCADLLTQPWDCAKVNITLRKQTLRKFMLSLDRTDQGCTNPSR